MASIRFAFSLGYWKPSRTCRPASSPGGSGKGMRDQLPPRGLVNVTLPAEIDLTIRTGPTISSAPPSPSARTSSSPTSPPPPSATARPCAAGHPGPRRRPRRPAPCRDLAGRLSMPRDAAHGTGPPAGGLPQYSRRSRRTARPGPPGHARQVSRPSPARPSSLAAWLISPPTCAGWVLPALWGNSPLLPGDGRASLASGLAPVTRRERLYGIREGPWPW
jgi:hypothetical protein